MSNALALCAIATILLAEGRVSVRYESRSPTVSCQSESFLLPHRTQSPSSTSSHREQNCCAQTRLVRVTQPRPCIRYFGWSRNRRRRTVPYHLRGATRPLAVSYSTGDLFLCSPYSYRRTPYYTRAFRALRPIRT